MSKINSKVPNFKQNFKAIENFLRRIAYNLGNSPSQTEVKIVSCIPIDVTDLQQKIFQLQNELADLKNVKSSPLKVICSTCAKRNENNPKPVYCNECLLSATSVLSVYCPGHNNIPTLKSSSVCPFVNSQRAEITANTEKPNKPKRILSKNKKIGKNKNLKTHLVYHAHADTDTPFRYNGASMQGNYNKRSVFSRTYLADVLQRQYQHVPRMKDSNQSDISSPVCRDNFPIHFQRSPCSETDECSCCNQFQNIDNYMNNTNNQNIYPTCENTENYSRNSYYDSSFYDIVPVKEKVNKYKKNGEQQQGKEFKKPTIKCWPGKARLKNRTKPTVVNYCALSPPTSAVCDYYGRKNQAHWLSQKDVVMNGMDTKRFEASTPRQVRKDIDYCPNYTKEREKKRIKQTMIPSIIKQMQYAATGSLVADNIAGRQTAATITENYSPEDKTEITLNQIKNILQSVLTEVKTSSKFGMSPLKTKKDAVVQSGPSLASRGCEFEASQLLQSYTYSPYNINPYSMNINPYKPSCSHPISSKNYVYPQYPAVPGMPYQQYPLLIQPQKHLCTNYNRNSNINKAVTKRAASAATNTEQAQEHSKETERLIKEIYKSIALNMEDSSNNNSVLEYMKTKSITDKYVNLVKTESDTESEHIAKAISEIFKNSDLLDSTATATTASNFNTYLEPKSSGKITKELAKKEYRAERAKKLYPQKKRFQYVAEQEKERKPHKHYIEKKQSDTTIINEITEESSSETETTEEVEVKKEGRPVKAVETEKAIGPAKSVKREKSSIFKKMLKIFQPIPRRRQRDSVANDSQKNSESDSDDYQTVYSQKVATPKVKKVPPVRSRAHSKVFYSKQHWPRNKSPDKYHRVSPYMEQENRRYWDEKLMFDNQRKRHSTNVSRGTGDRSRRTTNAYYQNYEARPVLVDPIRRVPLRMPGNYVSKPRHSPCRGQCGRQSENCNERNFSRSNMTTKHASHVKPHFVASKSNAKRKGIFSKGWLKKTKLQCGQCGEEWKDLIFNS